MSAYRWLLLDADNTLFDFNAAEDYALTRTLTHFGVPVEPRYKEGYRQINQALWAAFEQGKLTQEILARRRFELLLKGLGMDGDPEEWNRFYISSLANCPALLPGAESLCRRLADRYVLALITNGIPSVQRGRLSASPLTRFFEDRVFISGEMGCQKPEKRYFDLVLDALGIRSRRSQVLVVGDSLSSDIRGAFNARLDSVWLRWPGVSVPPGSARPTYEVGSLNQLAQLLGSQRMVPDPY